MIGGTNRQFLHDPKTFANPSSFEPSRFLDEKGNNIFSSVTSSGCNSSHYKSALLDPWKISFGFGRRICPGRHLVSASMFIAYATLLALFNFEIDEERDPEPDLEFLPGFVR